MHRKYRHNHFKSAKKPGRRSRHGTHGSKTAPPKPRRRQGQRERARYQKKKDAQQKSRVYASVASSGDAYKYTTSLAGQWRNVVCASLTSPSDADDITWGQLELLQGAGIVPKPLLCDLNNIQRTCMKVVVASLPKAEDTSLPGLRYSPLYFSEVEENLLMVHLSRFVHAHRNVANVDPSFASKTTSNRGVPHRACVAAIKCVQAAVRDDAGNKAVSALLAMRQRKRVGREFIEDVAFHTLCVAAFHGRANTVNAIMNMSTDRPLQWQRLMCAMITSALRDGGAVIAARWGCAPPLFLAIAQGHSNVIHALLAHNNVTAAINEAFPWTSTTNNGGDSDRAWTALGVAISCGDTSIVAQLLEVPHIALNLARRDEDISSLTLAVHRAKPEIVRLLLQHRPAQPLIPSLAAFFHSNSLQPNFVDDSEMAPIARAFAQWSSSRDDSSASDRASIIHMLLDDPRIDVNVAPSRRSSSATLLHAMITGDLCGRRRGGQVFPVWHCSFNPDDEHAAGTLLLACDRVDVDAKAFELAVGHEGCDGALKALLARPTTADTATDCLQGIASLLGKATEAHRGGAIKLLLSSWVVDSGRLTWSEDEAGVWPPGSNAALAREQLAGPISVLTAFANSEPSRLSAVWWVARLATQHTHEAVLCSCSSHRTFEEDVEEEDDGIVGALHRLSREQPQRKEAAEAVACLQSTARWRRRRALALVREQRLAGQDWKVPLEAMQ